jgi:hypothetical protein
LLAIQGLLITAAGHGVFLPGYLLVRVLYTLGRLNNFTVSDVLELDQRTVEMWQRCISKKSDKFHAFICTLLTLNLLFLHKDELWSYLGKKQKQRWGFHWS